MTSRRGIVLRWIISLGLLWAAAWLLLNRQQVIDQFVVWQYQPSPPIAALVERADFSERGKFLFYASQPQLNDQKTFNQHCKSLEEESVVLGCYSAQRIYIYNISDKRLDGIKEVTAAHEMLHAAYERLSESERSQVNKMIEKEMVVNRNERLQERLKLYEKTEPGERDNELHSILGTEVAQLSSELEAYYARYFTRRSLVTTLFAKYEAVFVSLENQQKQLVAQLESMAATIKARVDTFNQSIVAINNAIESFNARASSSGGFSSVEEFNAARAELTARQESLRLERDAINAQIADFNKKRSELESLNLRAKELQNSVDSTPAPVPAL